MPNFTKTVTYNDVDLEVNFDMYRPVPARIWGPPESCHPAEGGEAEICSVSIGEWDITSLLSEKVLDWIEDQLEANAEELFEPEPYEPESDDDPFQGDR